MGTSGTPSKPPSQTSSCAHLDVKYTHETSNPAKFTCCLCQDHIGVKKDGRWHCSQCQGDLCQSCRPPPFYTEATCSNKHPLVDSDADNDKYKGKYACDNCGAIHYTALSRWCCLACSFDICHNCKPRAPFSGDHCPKGHTLTFQMAIFGSRVCSYCTKHSSGGQWFCRPCGYIVCTNCKHVDGVEPIYEFGAKGLASHGIQIKADIVGTVCSLEVVLGYLNTMNSAIETEWEWPIDKVTSVVGMAAVINGVEHEGQLSAKEKAQTKYADTVSEGHTGYLVQYSEDNGRIKLLMGNVAPKSEVLVKIRMVRLLEIVQDSWMLIIPSKGLEHNAKVDVSVQIQSPSKITSVTSISHKVNVDIHDAMANVRLVSWEEKDFVLKYQNENISYPALIVQKDPKRTNYAYQLSFVPDLGDTLTPGEHIFVLDKSGSMSGRPIELAKEACAMFIQSLPLGSYFNVCHFDDSFEFIFPTSVEYTETNKAQGLNDLKAISGGGGTEIYKPLESIFAQPPKISNRAKNVYLLTDGEVSDKEKVITLIQQHSNKSQVHSFGIGGGVDRDLILRSARAGKGEAAFISAGEDMTPKVITTLEKAVKPILTNINLTWPSSVKVEHQTALLDICSGKQLCVLAIADKLLNGQIHFSAINSGDGSKLERDLEVMGTPKEGSALYAIAAAQLMQERTSPAQRVALSLEYGVLCNATALFLKQKQAMPSMGELVQTKVGALPDPSTSVNTADLRQQETVPRPYDSEVRYAKRALMSMDACSIGEEKCMQMPSRSRGPRKMKMAAMCPPPCNASPEGFLADHIRGPPVRAYSPPLLAMEVSEKEQEEPMQQAAGKKSKPTSKGVDYKTVASKQEVKGNWNLTTFCPLLSIDISIAMKSMPSSLAGLAPELAAQVWATLLALSVLKTKCQADYICWKLIEAKALAWLKSEKIDLALRVEAETVLTTI